MLRITLLSLLLLVMAGCQAQAVKPQTSAPGDQQAADKETAGKLQSYFSRMVKSNEEVQQRITLMQEQVIKLNDKFQAVQQRNLQLLQAMQQMQVTQSQMAAASASAANSASGAEASGVSNEDIQQTLTRIEQVLATGAPLNASAGGAPGFRLVSAYTPKGQWVIFKYDESTGLTWKAEDGGWKEIDELQRLPVSRYEVVLRPAAGDIKGYVAARVDRQTGESWWLKGNSWEAFQ